MHHKLYINKLLCKIIKNIDKNITVAFSKCHMEDAICGSVHEKKIYNFEKMSCVDMWYIWNADENRQSAIKWTLTSEFWRFYLH